MLKVKIIILNSNVWQLLIILTVQVLSLKFTKKPLLEREILKEVVSLYEEKENLLTFLEQMK